MRQDVIDARRWRLYEVNVECDDSGRPATSPPAFHFAYAYYGLSPVKGTTPVDTVTEPQSRNSAILAAILEKGGSVSQAELLALVKEHSGGTRIVGALHGRRLAHLRKNPEER